MYVLMGPTAGKPPGRSQLSSCSLVLRFMAASRMFWDFGSSIIGTQAGQLSGQLNLAISGFVLLVFITIPEEIWHGTSTG